MQTQIMEQRSVAKSVVIVKDFTLQHSSASPATAHTALKSVIAECFDDLTKCNGITIAFWVKGNEH